MAAMASGGIFSDDEDEDAPPVQPARRNLDDDALAVMLDDSDDDSNGGGAAAYIDDDSDGGGGAAYIDDAASEEEDEETPKQRKDRYKKEIDQLEANIKSISKAYEKVKSATTKGKQELEASKLKVALKKLAENKALFYEQVLDEMDEKNAETLSVRRLGINIEYETLLTAGKQFIDAVPKLVEKKKKEHEEIEKSIQAAKEGDAAAATGISSLQAIRDFIVQKDYSVRGVLRDNSSQKAAYKAKKRKQETEKNLGRARRAGQDDRGLSLPKWDGDEIVKDKDGNYKVKTGETEHPWPLVEIISPSDEPVFSFAMTYLPAIKDYQTNEIAINDEEKLKEKFSSTLEKAQERREKADDTFTNIIKEVRQSIFKGFTYEKYLGETKRKYDEIAPTFLESTKKYLMEKNRRVLGAFRFRIGKLQNPHYRLNAKIKNVIAEVMGVLQKTKEAIDQTLREEYATLMDELEQRKYVEDDDAMSDDDFMPDDVLESSSEEEEYDSDEESSSSAAAQPAAKRRKTKKLKAVAKPSVKPIASAKGRIKRNMVKNTKKQLVQLRF